MGLATAVVFVTDDEQRRLVPLPGRALSVRAPLAIDATMGRRAFMTQEVIGAATVAGDVLWTPTSAGAERLGVLEVAAPDTEPSRRDAEVLAAVAALQLVVRRRSADFLDRLRRRESMSLEPRSSGRCCLR